MIKSSGFYKVLLILLIIIAVAVAVAVVKQTRKRLAIQKEITDLQKQAEEINQSNLDIQDKIAYLASNDYKEREAKDKLGLKKPDEKVVVFNPEVNKPSTVQDSSNQAMAIPLDSRSNYQRWWDYFFSR